MFNIKTINNKTIIWSKNYFPSSILNKKYLTFNSLQSNNIGCLVFMKKTNNYWYSINISLPDGLEIFTGYFSVNPNNDLVTSFYDNINPSVNI